MSGLAAVSPKQQFKSALGIPLVGGTLDVFLSGTTTRTNTWQDKALTSLNTNPITLDSRGECLLWLDPTITYKLVLKDVLGVTQWTVDNVAGPFVASNITFTQAGTGAVSRTSQDKMREVVSLMDFGAAGDGVADDTTAFGNFLAASTGKVCLLPAGTYKLTSLVTKALTNCRFIGVPGQTIVTGSFGYALLRLLDVSNVTFEGVSFVTSYVNAVEDLGASVVYSLQNNVTNLAFSRCKFSSVNANTSGLTIYARITAVDTSGTINGLWIEDCDFTDVGRIGCTIMNRNTGAYTAAQRVYFNRNRGNNLGTKGSFGFLVSFDGYGQHFTCNDNLVDGALGIGIENKIWRNGEFRGNRFRNFATAYAPMSFSGASSGLLIEGNRTMEPSKTRSNFVGVTDSRFRDNYFEATGDYAFHTRDSLRNVFEGDTYKSDNIHAALIGSSTTTTTDNLWRAVTFDTSGSAANTAVIRFDGTGTTRNLADKCTILKGTGGTITDQVNSAVGNFVDNYIDGTSLSPGKYLTVSMSDADFTFSGRDAILRYGAYRLTGTLTANRTVNFPAGLIAFDAWNDTAFQLTLTPSGGSGVVLFPGQRARVVSNGTNLQGWGALGASWNSGQGHLKLGDYSLWVDSSGRLRIKSGEPTSETDGTVVGTQV